MRLTIRLLRAMDEALNARTAGEIDIVDDPECPSARDYDDAWEWVVEQIGKREKKSKP